ELRTSTRATLVDPVAQEVEISSGERLHYDRLLMATGAEPRRLSLPGSGLDGIHYLRTLSDADAIRNAIAVGEPTVIIGAGWIGCEVAASARQLGADITMVDPLSVPLERVLGPEVGRIFQDLHQEHGVRVRCGVGVEAIRGRTQVEEVVLTDGTSVPAGTVIAGIGVLPRTELADAAAMEVDNGIVTDEYLACSVPGVFAAGDVANSWYPIYGQRIRLEHWSAALNQGPVAARNMLGQQIPYDRTPFFYSDQYDLSMEYRGWVPDWDQVALRGDPSSRQFLAFWVSKGRVAAVMNVNVWDQTEQIENLLRSGRTVDTATLADPQIDLSELGG
ncbi:MAG TPA: FAD-dependent oxidoreductase, partial [Acidimicrobiales bacterium]|nr:FAD-dependent oxidoreductase [Acidimicrobiales bacterium]